MHGECVRPDLDVLLDECVHGPYLLRVFCGEAGGQLFPAFIPDLGQRLAEHRLHLIPQELLLGLLRGLPLLVLAAVLGDRGVL